MPNPAGEPAKAVTRSDDTPLTLLLLCYDRPPPERNGIPMEFGAQNKAGDLHAGSPEAAGVLRFALAVVARVAPDREDIDFAGPFVHGKSGARFLYLGYRPLGESAWTRRWKIPLVAITATQLAAAQQPGQALQARVTATSGSTAQPLGEGWAVVAADARLEVKP